MSLAKYKKKRDFTQTQEPKGARAKTKGEPIFVIQEHHASHLHWDFRLELDGVLKSWAVPKGIPETVGEKRLAVEVEDHPLSYATFAGEIPKGQYGGGHVLIWDNGNWKPTSKTPLADLKKGRLEFDLAGERLNGRWILVRTGRAKSWLLIRRHGGPAEELPPPKKAAAKRTKKTGKSVAFPDKVDLQLAELVERPPTGPEWLHEIKYDGYRTQARIDAGKTKLITRNGLDWTAKYGTLAAEFDKLKLKKTIIDGEIAALDEHGRTNFHSLQQALSHQKTEGLVYYAFDLPFLNGQDLRETPLVERKEKLQRVLEKVKKAKSRIVFSEDWSGSSKELLKQSCELKLEGIVSKRKSSMYDGGRGPAWQKSKCGFEQEFVIAGYTKPKGARSSLGALLLSVRNDEGGFDFVGKVGTGFDDKTLRNLLSKLKKLTLEESPLTGKTPFDRAATWVKPKYIAQISFGGWTGDRHLRHSVFKGLREDKKATEVVLEKPKKAGMRLTHPSRIVFPESKITKQELLDYYLKISEAMLPLMANRPLALLRCPEGVSGECFFQKHARELGESGIKAESVRVEREKKKSDIMYIDGSEGLSEIVQMGAIEIHSWGAHRPKIESPDMIVFDLDPGPDVSWNQVREGAFAIKETLEHLNLTSFLKVTGGKGLHLHVPVEPIYDWDEIKSFAKTIVTELAEREPKLYTAKMTKSLRGGKIFLDYFRNGFGATAVAPYSVRARGAGTIAIPVAWKELTRQLKPDQFTIRDFLSQKKSRANDPWKGIENLQKISILGKR